MKTLRIFFAVLMVAAAVPAAGQAARGKGKAKGAKSAATLPTPNILGAKAFLEEVLAKRYALDLATVVKPEHFTVGAQLDLVEVPQTLPASATPEEDPQALPADLLLGTIDADALLKKFGNPEAAAQMGTFLSGFKITQASIVVGVKHGTAPDVKALLEKRLTERVKNEFGALGKSSVNVVYDQKEFFDELNRFQGLAGNAVIALAIVLGALFWAMSKKSARSEPEMASAAAPVASAPAPAAPVPAVPTEQSTKVADAEETKILKDIATLTGQLESLGGVITLEREAVIRSWCEGGDEGKLKLACFAEATGRSIGKLPIPADFVADLTQVFAKMPQIRPEQKRDALSQAYWDLLAALNLGSQVLSKPFGYLVTANVESVNQALIEQNLKMKTVVSLQMPPELRESYFKSLDLDAKKALLREAADLADVPVGEFREIDQTFKQKLSGGGDRKDAIPFVGALSRVAESLTPIEELTLLRELTGAGIQRYKTTVASLAFFEDWSQDKLTAVLGNVGTDELTAYLRVKPDLTERFLPLCPPLTAELVRDELSRPDAMSDAERAKALRAFATRLTELVTRGEVNLKDMFVAAEDGDGAKRAA